MGQALSTQSGWVTNPSGTFTALTMNVGDSATVPSFDPNSKAFFFGAWSPGAAAGVFRARSPRWHDYAQGIRMQRGLAVFEPLMPLEALQPVYGADTLTLEITGGAAETDMACFQLWYDNLPGIAARLAMPSDVLPRIKNIIENEVDCTSGAVGVTGTPRALNFTFDVLKAGVDYAILGYTVSAKAGLVRLYGPDTGNMKMGGPGLITSNDETRKWFIALSEKTGKPCIPIINANNRGTTFVEVGDVAAATAVNVSVVMAELG